MKTIYHECEESKGHWSPEKDDGTWAIRSDNDEYCAVCDIKYCPYCGVKLDSE